MGSLAASLLLPTKLKPSGFDDLPPLSLFRSGRAPPKFKKKQSFSPRMRLFGPAIFEASKLKVLFLEVDKEENHPRLPRTYTLTHSDITSKLTLAISQTINNSQLQGWYNKLQRDEVVGEWKKVKGKMWLHVHCHISGGHFLLDLCAWLRYYIFRKELPVVLKAFVHGDEDLFNNYPELQDALVWVYFHSNLPAFNKVECWGPLKEAVGLTSKNDNTTYSHGNGNEEDSQDKQEDSQDKQEDSSVSNSKWEMPEPCKQPCTCCFPSTNVIPWSFPLSQKELSAHISVAEEHQCLKQQQSL